LYLIYHQDSRPSAKLRSVIDFLIERLGENSQVMLGKLPVV